MSWMDSLVARIGAFLVCLGACTPLAAQTVLFSGGLDGWQTRFGAFAAADAVTILPSETIATDTQHMVPACPSYTIDTPPAMHAEAQRGDFVGADFTYSADITVASNAEAHLQFRIADQGRYGLKLLPSGAVLYRLMRLPETCDCGNPSTYTHCPNWPPLPPATSCAFGCDDAQYVELASAARQLAPGSTHRLTLSAQGSRIDAQLDGQPLLSFTDDAPLRIGRFGIYAFGATDADVKRLAFRNVTAMVDPTQSSNFAVLYSTVGYELSGTKRALVRTLNDLPASMYVAGPSRFFLVKCRPGVFFQVCDGPVKTGRLTPVGAAAGSPVTKTFGMQLWEADFTALVTEAGSYSLRVHLGTTSGLVMLDTAPFAVQTGLATATLLKPMSILNAQTRRAADDDMRRNWCFETASACTNDAAFRGSWSVALDGAFWADRADAAGGAVLRRVFNDNNEPLDFAVPSSFHYVGQVAVISGCDAQLQFRVTPTERLAVTLQGGSPAGCMLAGGPGGVRLHREGSAVPGGFETLAQATFPVDHPFQPGHPYDVDISVFGGAVIVSIDNGLVTLQTAGAPDHGGVFALKAFASTARFARVQVWNSTVPLDVSPALDRTSLFGSRIPLYPDGVTDRPVLYACQDFVHLTPGSGPPQTPAEMAACNPVFSMLHGFHDANNVIGEATSHGSFLDGLVELWTARASTFSADERESLRHAIQANALYLEELYQEGARNDQFTGEFTHSEMGRGGVDTNLGPYNAQDAVYGASAFADKGVFVDHTLAVRACLNALDGTVWLSEHGFFDDPTQQAVVYARLARCTGREPALERLSPGLWTQAGDAARAVLTAYDPANPLNPGGAIVQLPRDTGRLYPWFEGVYEVWNSTHRYLLGDTAAVGRIADLLASHLTHDHACDDHPTSGRCPANGFYVIPQASGGPLLPFLNWVNMERVPLVDRPVGPPRSVDKESPDFVQTYNIQGHFPAAVADALYLLRLTHPDPATPPTARDQDLERIASGNYYWMLGLNPGVPSQKVVNGVDSGPWRAAAFVRGVETAFSRVFEGYRTKQTSSKGSPLAPWEESPASPRREAWFVDIQDNGYRSTVNGHVIWDGQWDYWNVGKYGWGSGETFIFGDGSFTRSALLYEDKLAPVRRDNPYDTTHLAFFDTTHVDRVDTDWLFDDPDFSLYAQASRASTGFCDDKGFNGGRFTGHYIGERDGLLCTPSTAHFFDATDAEVDATGWGFADINTAPWAQVARAATGFCNARGFVGGFATGHQLPGLRGMVCLGGDVATWFDSNGQDLFNSGEGFPDINTVAWAKAARAATNICVGKGYSGGFFTGHQVNDLHGVVCLRAG